MSLSAQALVYIARKAIIAGNTWAGDNVVEQPVNPASNWYRDGKFTMQSPSVAVYYERADSIGPGDVQNLDLMIYVYLPPSGVALPEGVAFQPSVATAGLTLNIIGRQIESALLHADNVWGDLFRRFKTGDVKKSSRPVIIEIENAVRIPAIELQFEFATIPDPDVGKPITELATWTMLDMALRAEGNAVVADIFKALIESPLALPDYRLLQIQQGHTDASLTAMGLGPAATGATPSDGSLPILNDVDIINE